jgi:hypothetical protein
MYRYFPNKIPSSFLRNITVIAIFIVGLAFPQTKTNLEVLYSLNDSLVSQIVEGIPQNNDKIVLKLNLGDTYSIFSNHIKNAFINKGKEIFEANPDELNLPEINIVMEKAGVEYGEMERDGWFGDYYTSRTLFIDGNYLNTLSKKGLQQYHITATDTIKVDDIKLLENDSFPFTKGEIPAEPFFSSLWEPVIAIGAAAAAIILFFSVRNK